MPFSRSCGDVFLRSGFSSARIGSAVRAVRFAQKAPQLPEPCGIMHITDSQYMDELCSICQKIEAKERRVPQLEERL